MEPAIIVDAVRTPIGRRNGILRDWHPVDLSALVLGALCERNDLDPALVDDVIMGCVMQVGEQAANLARSAVLAAGWPEHVPGVTLDRQCGSGQQAIQFAAQSVMAGVNDVVVAGGVEVMTRVPMGATMADGQFGFPYGPSVVKRYSDVGGLVTQGVAAELVAERWGISRSDLDEYALLSQQRSSEATDEGRFDSEIVPVPSSNGRTIRRDEGIRPTDLEVLERLPAAFVADGVVTAGNSSQISDGAAATLVMSESAVERIGCRPRARIIGQTVLGDDPRLMLTAPIPATRRILDKAGLDISDIDLFEINEAFASVVLAWLDETKADIDRVNVNGGAIALGHPLGCSGARLTATLLNELERRGGGIGLQIVCEGGGMANAMLIETV